VGHAHGVPPGCLHPTGSARACHHRKHAIHTPVIRGVGRPVGRRFAGCPSTSCKPGRWLATEPSRPTKLYAA
jgi:hypothetical protein